MESDQDLDKFEEYGRKVYETMSSDSYRWAESLKGSLKEKASMFQKDLSNKHREWTFCLLHKMVYDRARRDKTESVGEGGRDLREAFFVRVNGERAGAAISCEMIKGVLMQNMSESTFPMQRVVETKGEASKTEREWILDMCPKKDSRTYRDGKELFLVRLMVNYLLQENEAADRELQSLGLMRSGGGEEMRSKILVNEDNSQGVRTAPNTSSKWSRV